MAAGVVTLASRSRTPRALLAEVRESLVLLEDTAAGLAPLERRAAALDERVRALAERERAVGELEGTLDAARGELDAQRLALQAAAGEGERRLQELLGATRELAEKARAHAVLAAELSAREQELERRLDDLERREARFARRWRWLLRVLSMRPWGRAEARPCELLMLPSPDGYRLLEQEGMALRKGATVSGLLAEERTFVVTKIAPWGFDGRWCAYLQEQASEGGRP
jgi:hypothetical protein